MSHDSHPVIWRGLNLGTPDAILHYHGRLHIDSIRGAVYLPDLDGGPCLDEVLPSDDYKVELRVIKRIFREGYASPSEGLNALLVHCVDVETATALYRKPDPVSKSVITEKIREKTLVAYQTGSGEYRIPTWQFRPEGGLVMGIKETLAVLRKSSHFDPITPFVFLLQGNPMTGNLPPLEQLKEGKIDSVLTAAREYAA